MRGEGFPAARTAVALLAAASMLAPGLADAATRDAPPCDLVAGRTVAQNTRWRIFVPGASSMAGGPTLACRRWRLASEVRLLSPGETPDDVTVVGLAGDLLVVASAGGGSGTTYSHSRLIDLSRGASTGLGGSYSSLQGEPRVDLTLALSSDGGIGRAQWGHPRSGGQLELWDAAGRAQTATQVTSIAAVAASGSGPAGVYYCDVYGRPGRAELRGPVPTAGLPIRKPLHWRSPELRALHTPDGLRRSELLTTRAWGAPRIDVLAGGTSQRAQIEVTSPGGRRRLVVQRLAPGSADELRVLATSGSEVLVAARFADRPGERRIRLVSGAASSLAKVDVLSTPAAEQPGHAVATSNEFLVADGTLLRRFSRHGEGTAALAPGARDLAWAGRTSVYLTGADGTVELRG